LGFEGGVGGSLTPPSSRSALGIGGWQVSSASMACDCPRLKASLCVVPNGGSAGPLLPQRQAVNTVVQGTAADLIKLALIRLNETLPDEVKMLLPVHDSILLLVPEGLVEEARRIVIEAMESTPEGFTVPLKVEVKVGKTWADCK
jgi:hypothetical protein